MALRPALCLMLWLLVLILFSPAKAEQARTEADSTIALLQATRNARAMDTLDDLLPLLSDLARDRLSAGDTATAAMIAAELVMLDSQDGSPPGRFGSEGRVLWALALLRSGHPDEALARLLPVLSLGPNTLPPTTARLITQFQTEAAVPDRTDWTNRGKVLEAARSAYDQTLLRALKPLNTALHQNDAIAANRAGRAAFDRVALDDPRVTTPCLALLLTLQNAGRNDLAATWAMRLGSLPPYYLASLSTDPQPSLEAAASWMLAEGYASQAVTLSEAIAALAPLRDATKIPEALYRLGAAYLYAGRLPDAKRTLRQALTALGSTNPAGALQIQSDLAQIAADQNDPISADAAFAAAHTLLATTTAGASPQAWANLLSRQRDVLMTQNRLPEALAVAQESVDAINRRGADPTLLQPALGDLAESQLALDDPLGAETTLTAALALGATPNLVALQATALIRLNDPAAATRLLTNFAAPADLDGITAVIDAALAALSMDDPGTVTRMMTIAAGLLTTRLNSLPPEHPMRTYLLARRADIEAFSDPQAALTDLRAATRALSQADRRNEPLTSGTLAQHVTIARRLAFNANGPADLPLMSEAYEVAQRVNGLSAAAALTRATARLQGDGPAAAILARQLDDADRNLTTARQALLTSLATGTGADAAALALQNARATRAKRIADLTTNFPHYAAFADPQPISLAGTAALLRPDEALLLYVSADADASGGAATSTVFAVTREGYWTAELPDRSTLTALARDLRCAAALTDPDCGTGRGGTRGAFGFGLADTDAPAFDLDLARRAGTILIDPVAAQLRGKTSLLIVPDRTLSPLPFDLLLTADSPFDTPLNEAPWLIRQAAITILPSVASLPALRNTSQRPSAATLPFLGIGDPLIGAEAAGPLPTYDCDHSPTLLAMVLSRGGSDTLPALPETRCELTRAAAMFGSQSTVLLQGKATESALKFLSQTGDLALYHVLSFATHGLIAGELGATNAALVLTPTPQDDGLLTSDEVAALRLDANFVILSACNTAAGNADSPEGLAGLASAFFLAGARAVMVSHWPVYSDAATDLTSGLVEAMAETPGLAKAEALRRSMLRILDDPNASARTLHPAYWAAFLISGDGD